jgi:HD-GYP domain-containing protein (c-di-GMP phosphodiesterase class II)
MCEVAQMLAKGVGVPHSVQTLLGYVTDRWDGRGPLRRAVGDALPLPMRIVHVALDANLQRSLEGQEYAVRLIRERSGRALDPSVATRLVEDAEEILATDHRESAWDETLACEPHPHLILEGDAIDRALHAMGNFADLISPYFSGNARGVADMAAAAADDCRLDTAAATALRRASLVHDVGRVAVGASTWEKSRPLNAAEWEQVRLHPYHTERVLSRSSFLTELASIAGAHHERLDGSGYHRGASGAALPFTARLLAAADAYHAMTERRPHREGMSRKQAAEALAHEAKSGRLDVQAVTAVIEGSGEPAPRLDRPAGLTEREAEVIAMVARGLQTKQVARGLGISVKTADRHVQNAYRKIGVSTRAAATLFAMEHGLIAWGELPMARLARRS